MVSANVNTSLQLMLIKSRVRLVVTFNATTAIVSLSGSTLNVEQFVTPRRVRLGIMNYTNESRAIVSAYREPSY